MKCPKCQFENLEEMNFCGKCGFNLRNDRKKPPKSDYHSHSYTPKFLSDKILTTRSSIEGERKLVTVLFADVANYTSMSEQLNPEEVHQIMDGCFKILMDEIQDHQGTINQFTGDGVMALFGAPLALENHAKKACEASLAIQNAIKSYSKEIEAKFAVSFKMRIGLNSGQVVVGSIGDDLRMDYTAIGDTTNLAARMESTAEAGTILISPNTYKQIKQNFIFEPMGRIKVKGKEEPLDVYKLVSKTNKAEIGLERQIFFETVGRDKELNKLELQIMKAINGQGSVVNIIGEAGIGKSRIIADLKKKDVMKNVAILEGKSISIGRNLSFYPIINLLKHWLRIKDDDSDVIALRKLEGALRSVCPEDADEILPFVATIMGMKLLGKYAQRVKGIEGEALEKLILKNMKDLLTKASNLSPLVIVMEDMHWADKSSIGLMQSLFRLAETQRILFINVFRPRYKETGDKIVKTIKDMLQLYYVEIVLEPLNEKMSEALITRILTSTKPQQIFIRKIVQRAGGNPFFIEEVLRSLIDEHAVVLKDGKFHVTEKVGTINIPHKISDVLMSRIDRLEVQARELVKVASVIGRNFFYRILSEVANTVQNIDDRLSYLIELELIQERKRMEELEYLLKHALAQEAAYDSILPQKQKELHLKVANSIEKVFGEKLHEFYGMLAYHYGRGENLDKAEEYLLKAGEEALKSSASNEAMHYYEEGLNLYLQKNPDQADPEKVAMLEKNIALALYNRGQYVEALEYFDKALNYYWGKLPQNAVSSLFKFSSAFFNFLITIYFPSMKFRNTPTARDIESISLFYKKIKALSMIEPKRFFFEYFYLFKKITNFNYTEFELGFEAFAAASSLFSFTGISFGWSRKILDLAKQRAFKYGDKICLTYNLLDTVHNYLKGNWKAIGTHREDLINNSLNNGELYDASLNLYWHGLPYINQGSLNLAQSIVDKLNDIFEVYEHNLSQSLKYELNTYLLAESRKLNDALIEVEEGIALAKKTDLSTFLLDLYPIQAWIHLSMGDAEKAGKSLKNAHKIKGEVDAPVPFQILNFCRSQVGYDLYRLNESIKNGNKKESFKYRKKAIKSCGVFLKQSKKVARHRTESYRLKGVYCWLVNKQKIALKWWMKSIQEGKRLGARLELSRTYFEVGKRLLEPVSKYKALNGIKADEYLAKAKIMFEEMDLQWDLDELAKLNLSHSISS